MTLTFTLRVRCRFAGHCVSQETQGDTHFLVPWVNQSKCATPGRGDPDTRSTARALFFTRGLHL